MFQLDETQSQGDTDFQLSSDYLAKPTTCAESPLISEDLEKFQFLDSLIESCEKDWQDTNMELTEESFNLSQIIDMNFEMSSEIPVEEQSYNLNSISAVPSDLEFWSIPENDQAILQTLISCPIEVSFLEENNKASIEDVEDSNATQLTLAETSSTVTFSDSDSSENLTHLAGKKYLEMRRKNNIASQRSRKIRKQKNKECELSLKKLEKENKDLLAQALRLEKERDKLKNQLMAILAKK
ncbi:hypothetical protein JTE90_001085 [Oedothorax gibbosus]|uniref:BZIP domain-containing protein n=1 Tax=Oedothorax gibbosus TaxID=931172 RepID=A0AAV6UKP8_9ARAC|nr:hypothetical protein JTE90_001085 [Oedothorax gibbosus]